jgi:RimJ/RimL family protein N-acetyltransferase
MFIRTERLFLRPAWAEDAPAVAAQIADWDVVRNLARAPWPYTLADAAAFCSGAVLAAAESAFLIFCRTDGDPQLIGAIGFGRVRDGRDIELGYWLGRAHWGRGYAVEAGSAVLDLAFDGLRLDRLTAGHFADNPASGKVLRKLGFVPTGEVISYPCKARRSHVLSVEYELTRHQWAR